MSKKQLRSERMEKLNNLRAAGIDPYGERFTTTGFIDKVRALCPEEQQHDIEQTPVVRIAGRVMAVRDMGKSVWIDLRDHTAKIQCNIIQKRIANSFELLKNLDIGDFLGIVGNLAKSRTGEITVFASEFVFLSKNIEPLPAKFKGLKDVELRFRKRYMDMVANPDSLERFLMRTKIIKGVRAFLDMRGYIEVETPMLQVQYGGAAARPFVTHHNALNMDLYLRISPETYLKRLLVGGMDRVYEINRNFRNEGIDASHNPEFTMLELYEAYADYEVMMEIIENMVSTLASELLGTTKIRFGDLEVDVTAPWQRKSMAELIRDIAEADTENDESMRSALRKIGFDQEKLKMLDHDHLMAEVMDEIVEPRLINPTFVTQYPASLNPLSKRNRKNPNMTDRFEVIVAGMEIANAFSELNDPIEQRARFEEQVAKGGEENYCNAVDEDYITALEVGMPPAGGMGIGIDRLVMLLTGQTTIREVVLFPTLKPRIGSLENEYEEESSE